MSSSIRGGQRRPVSLIEPDLVQVGSLPGREGKVPALITPSRSGVDLASWGESHRPEVEALLAQYGAVLFRGFGISSLEMFSRSAGSFVDALFGDYGDLPREGGAESVFSSTPYPADLEIHFHNESAHMAQWPMRIFFHCAIAAETGGETPIIDCRALMHQLDPAIVDEFERKGLTYVRNFGKGIDVSWQDFFGTTDAPEVEARCAAAGTSCEWLPDGVLRIKQDAAGVLTHPVSGERVFFNQVLLHHPAALPDDTREALSELYDVESFPRNVTYGDGSTIPDPVIHHLLDRYAELAVLFRWEAGDMILLDNMLVSHSRAPFTGARKIVVAMAHIHHADDAA
jgi:alpha-ketoglutarate-dependent taurine dioxygenase